MRWRGGGHIAQRTQTQINSGHCHFFVPKYERLSGITFMYEGSLFLSVNEVTRLKTHTSENGFNTEPSSQNSRRCEPEVEINALKLGRVWNPHPSR